MTVTMSFNELLVVLMLLLLLLLLFVFLLSFYLAHVKHSMLLISDVFVIVVRYLCLILQLKHRPSCHKNHLIYDKQTSR